MSAHVHVCVPYQLLQPVGKRPARRGQAWAMGTVLGARQNIQANLEEFTARAPECQAVRETEAV